MQANVCQLRLNGVQADSGAAVADQCGKNADSRETSYLCILGADQVEKTISISFRSIFRTKVSSELFLKKNMFLYFSLGIPRKNQGKQKKTQENQQVFLNFLLEFPRKTNENQGKQ